MIFTVNQVLDEGDDIVVIDFIRTDRLQLVFNIKRRIFYALVILPPSAKFFDDILVLSRKILNILQTKPDFLENVLLLVVGIDLDGGKELVKFLKGLGKAFQLGITAGI